MDELPVESRKYLNLGCGHRHHPEWVNIDVQHTGADVIVHNFVRKGIPFPDCTFNVVYHSHVLEHIPCQLARPFLQECFRVLVVGGILRIAVPDLEQIAVLYLESLAGAMTGSRQHADNHAWMLLEMYDQAVRTRAGGAMHDYLVQPELPNKDFVVQRLGTEALQVINQAPSFIEPAASLSLRCREYLLRLLLGQEYAQLQAGRFRASGEVHHWMYDAFSLQCLLARCGYSNVCKRTAQQSYVPGWADFNLDTEPDGSLYKPDSLFMEGVKQAPGQST